MMKRLCQIAIIAVFIVTLTPGLSMAQPNISPEEVFKWQKKNTAFLLIDVRHKNIFKLKHIERAINIPSFAINKKGIPKGKKIVLYDGGIGSVEAREAAGRLIDAGYTSVFILEGGLARWEASGLPLVAPVGLLDTRLVGSITATELDQAISDGLVMTLIDLRKDELFRKGTIPGALSTDPKHLPRISSGWQKDSLIILFDGGGDEAVKQAEVLRRAGFKIVRYLFGGYPEWKRKNTQ